MKQAIIALMSGVILLLPWHLCSGADDTEQWIPFSFPEKLTADSPYNIGKLVLDAPAGKHGFVTAKNGHFYFSDGTRARFWGTNLCFDACFPTHKQAELLAERIAFFGFNAVRLHHMDSGFAPRGIFKDICPAFTDPQRKKTGVLSEKQLDRLDYLIWCLKKRGIYIDINLLVSRRFTEADGLKDAAICGIAAKPITLFNPHLIKLQQEYAIKLLTHKNPYTNLRYTDEPALALIEITNENSLLADWHNNRLAQLPAEYQHELDARWNSWLQQKYKTVTAVKNAWLPAASAPIDTSPLATDDSQWTLEQHQGAAATLTVSDKGFTLQARKITATPWHLQFRTSGIRLVKNQTYFLNFSAYAEQTTPVSIVCQQEISPWKNLGLSETVQLTSKWQDFHIPFIAEDTEANTKLAVIFGNAVNTIRTKNIHLAATSPDFYIDKLPETDTFTFKRPLYKLRTGYPPEQIKDCRDFYIELEKNFFSQMLHTLRQELIITIPITGIGGYPLAEDALAMQDCDYMDKHAYWDHPQFPHSDWDKNDFRIHNKSLLQDPRQGFIDNLVSAGRTATQQGKPFTVTEWNHCYPNQYAYETPLLLAATAADHDWDALFQFAFSHGWNRNPDFNSIHHSYFDTIANPQQLVLCALSSYIFLKQLSVTYAINEGMLTIDHPQLYAAVGKIAQHTIHPDNLNLIIDDNGALILFANGEKLNTAEVPVLFTIGEIKNSTSGWNNTHFTWGHEPTLLKKVRVAEASEKKLKILP